MILDDAKTALDKQNTKGLEKYGGPLDDTKPSALELTDHAIEEAADQLMYLVGLKAEVVKLRAGIFHIMAATRDGKVSDDVAWLDEWTTLWDHCAWLVNWDGDPQAPLPVDIAPSRPK